MKQQMVKFDNIKFAKVRKNFASNIEGLSKGITKLTAMDGAVTPEQVSQVLNEEVLPAIQGVEAVIAQIDEALPTPEDEGRGPLGDLGNGEGEIGNDHGEGMMNHDDDETGVLSANTNDDDDDEMHTARTDAEAAALQKRLQHVEAKLASMVQENVNLQRAKLAKLYASTFPPQIRTAMEHEFLEENKDEEVEAMEAKLASASKVFESYKTAGLLKKASMPSIVTLHTAKMTTKSGAEGNQIPWYMR